MGDQDAVGGLVHSDIAIQTERAVHRGKDAAAEWAGKGFDHLIRRYEPVEMERTPEGVVVQTDLQYVWRDSGEVGDTTRVVVVLGIRDGLISSWRLIEDDAGTGG